jgi:mannose-6-phosphate isomerase-like protein (cupin superfamily)
MFYVFVLAAMLGLSAGDTAAQQRRAVRNATLAIQVSDPGGTPIGGVMVTVEGAASKSSRTEAGKIVFEGIPAGAYRLRFEKEGFVTLERELTARAGAPVDVKVTLTPAPAPAPEPEPPAPEPKAPTPSDAKPVTLDLPAVIEQEFIGRGAGRTTPLGCADGGHATLIQVREPVAAHAHEEADEFLYVIAGEGSSNLGGREWRLKAGVFMMVPRGITHTLIATGRNPLMLLSTRAGEACGAAR